MRTSLAAIASAFVVAAAVAGAYSPPAGAATRGLAFDSVTRIAPGTAAASFQPGSFQSDFKTASEPAPAESDAPGTMTGGTPNVLARVGAMLRGLQSASAQRHYVAGSKVRTDSLATQSATIVDCAAGTSTTLDLSKKTYKTQSLETAASPGPQVTGTPHPAPSSGGTKVGISLTSKRLGDKTIERVPTEGYSADVHLTVAQPDRAPFSTDIGTLAYFSSYALPAPVCPQSSAAALASITLAGGSPMTAGYEFLERMLNANGGDQNLNVHVSGAPLPAGKLSLFDVVTIPLPLQISQQFFVITERGNVRPVSDDDPVFSVPPDFKELK